MNHRCHHHHHPHPVPLSSLGDRVASSGKETLYIRVTVHVALGFPELRVRLEFNRQLLVVPK